MCLEQDVAQDALREIKVKKIAVAVPGGAEPEPRREGVFGVGEERLRSVLHRFGVSADRFKFAPEFIEGRRVPPSERHVECSGESGLICRWRILK
jgi:hypothetical protein